MRLIWSSGPPLTRSTRCGATRPSTSAGMVTDPTKMANTRQSAEFLRCTIGTGPIFIPTVSMADGTVSFTDGRHRFAWLRDHGLRALPVEVDQDSVETCRTCFGTTERVGRFDSVVR
ncbi:plasmid fertility inhibition factor family protein [Burkholderia pseudomallei]|uniref:plasmid fertility inhibition factor family protein n=1 Tax=Burkholderia TaxID=32008 RepID=UPI0035C8120E